MTTTLQQPRRELVLGIDFGTTYSSAAVLINGKCEFVLDRGDPFIPSVVHIEANGTPVVGRSALLARMRDPRNTVASIKRLLGSRIGDPITTQLKAANYHELHAGRNNVPVLRLRKREFTAARLAGYILSYIRSRAELRFGGPITRAVVAVPAGASGDYVADLRKAAAVAHLEITQVVAAPIAAAVALGLTKEVEDQSFIVCDWGGGTLGAALIEHRGNLFSPVRIAGTHLVGGDDLDIQTAESVAAFVYRQCRYDMHRDIERWHELVRRCETVKRALSTSSVAVLKMRDAYIARGELRDIDIALERDRLQARWGRLFERASTVLEQINDAARDVEVSRVVLVGGTAQMPSVRRHIREYFGKPTRIAKQTELAVTVGATMQGSVSPVIATHLPRVSAAIT